MLLSTKQRIEHLQLQGFTLIQIVKMQNLKNMDEDEVREVIELFSQLQQDSIPVATQYVLTPEQK